MSIKEELFDDEEEQESCDYTAPLVNQYILPCLHQSNASVLRNPNQLDPASNASAQLKCESAEESDHNSDMEEDTHHYECK
jgi:hypothetical protein